MSAWTSPNRTLLFAAWVPRLNRCRLHIGFEATWPQCGFVQLSFEPEWPSSESGPSELRNFADFSTAATRGQHSVTAQMCWRQSFSRRARRGPPRSTVFREASLSRQQMAIFNGSIAIRQCFVAPSEHPPLCTCLWRSRSKISILTS